MLLPVFEIGDFPSRKGITSIRRCGQLSDHVTAVVIHTGHCCCRTANGLIRLHDRCLAAFRLIQRDSQCLLELCLNSKAAFGCGNGQRICLGLFFSQRYIGTRDFPACECAGLCRLKLQFRAGHGLDHIAIGIFAAVDRYLTGAFNADSALAGVIQHDLRLLYFAVDIRDGEGDLLPRVGAVRFEGDVLIIGTVAVAHFHIRGKAQRRSLGIAAGCKFPYGHI